MSDYTAHLWLQKWRDDNHLTNREIDARMGYEPKDLRRSPTYNCACHIMGSSPIKSMIIWLRYARAGAVIPAECFPVGGMRSDIRKWLSMNADQPAEATRPALKKIKAPCHAKFPEGTKCSSSRRCSAAQKCAFYDKHCNHRPFPTPIELNPFKAI